MCEFLHIPNIINKALPNMALEIPGDAKSLHNYMVLELSDNIGSVKFDKLKYLLLDNPLCEVERKTIDTFHELCVILKDKLFISYGDYGKLLPKLDKINPRLRLIVNRYSTEINKIIHPELDDCEGDNDTTDENSGSRDSKGADRTEVKTELKDSIPVRIKQKTICSRHQGTQLEYYCQDCDQLICDKCKRGDHRRHDLIEELDDMIPGKKYNIEQFIKTTEKDHLVQIQGFIGSTDSHLHDNFSTFDKLSNDIEAQNNSLKERLDQLSAETLSMYNQMEEENATLLQTYKQDLEMYSKELKKKVQECEIVLRIGSNIDIFVTDCDIHSEESSTLNLPKEPILEGVRFYPNPDHQQHLEIAFGFVKTSGISQQSTESMLPDKVSSDQVLSANTHMGTTQTQIGRTISTLPQRENGRIGVSSWVYTISPLTKLLEHRVAPRPISALSLTTDDRCWSCCSGNNILTLLDTDGKKIDEVTHTERIYDISFSPVTNTLWVCDWDCNVMELVSGRLEKRFETEEGSECICITANCHVILGQAGKISKFTRKGKLILTKQVGKTLKKDITNSLSECPVTTNIAVSCWNDDMENSKGLVLVLDAEWNDIFVYHGEVPHATTQPSGRPFNPSSVLYDSAGNLLIGDYDNNRILLIGASGQFLRILYTDHYRAGAIGVDKYNTLFAVFKERNIRLLQYYGVISPVYQRGNTYTDIVSKIMSLWR